MQSIRTPLMASMVLVLSLSIMAQERSASSGPVLRVWPEVLHVRSGYPARFGVALQSEDGSIASCEETQLNLEVLDRSVAQLESPRSIRGEGSGTTRLRVTYLGESIERTIHVVVAPPQEQFSREISAMLTRLGCNLGTCHGNLHGKGGFRLSLRGDDPWLDFHSITQDSNGRRIDRFDARSSLLVAKPLGIVPHQGGKRMGLESREHQLLIDWIERGASWRPERARPSSIQEKLEEDEQIVRLDVEPNDAWLAPSTRAVPLVVTATWKDGSIRDVTDWCKFETSSIEGVEVDANGVVHAKGAADVSISVSYLRSRAACRLVFLESTATTERLDRNAEQHRTGVTSEETNTLDNLIEHRLTRLNIAPLPIADDLTRLRRLFLVSIGRLPTSTEIRTFEGEEPEGRWNRWVDFVLADDGFNSLWAMHWSDLLKNEPKVMSRKGTEIWNEWFRQQYALDRPLDAIVYDLIASTGSTYEHPPASFHRTHRDPMSAAESIGQVFLGVRLQCARCHNHPFDRWKQDDYYGLAAYFSTIERMQIDNKRPDELDKHIITGDEIISLAKSPIAISHPGRSREIGPRPLDSEGIVEARPAPTTSDDESNPLREVATWLTKNNRPFARNMANRIWYHLMGRGIVDAPDDFRDSNPPSNPELLEYITEELIRSGFSTRHLSRMILVSRAFSRESLSQESPQEAIPAMPVFAGYRVRRMPAEVLLDAISEVTGVATQFQKQKKDEGENIPEIVVERAIRFAAIPRNGGFLKAFGKPDRLLVCECERSSEGSLVQSLLMLNGEEVRERVSHPRNRISDWFESPLEDQQILEDLYLSTLARRPTDSEKTKIIDHLRTTTDRRLAWEDILWALINSKEFSLIR